MAKGGVVDLFVVLAVVLATKELMFEGVRICGVTTSSWFELMEAVCGVGIGLQEGGEIQFASESGVIEDINSCFLDRTFIPCTRVGVCSS